MARARARPATMRDEAPGLAKPLALRGLKSFFAGGASQRVDLEPTQLSLIHI